jgi:hypothetical protein
MRWLLASVTWLWAGCGCPHDGRTGNVGVDACLHWTACAALPPLTPSTTRTTLASCVMAASLSLPWTGDPVVVTPAQLSCMADAGLDCDRALDCVSVPATTPCPSPTWGCDGDTLRRCDAFRGDRVVSEDCAAEGLHCIPVGSQARCGFEACDPTTLRVTCLDNRIVLCARYLFADGTVGGVLQPGEDCSDHDATCVVGTDGPICVGKGAACTPFPWGGGLACDGDVLIGCENGYETRTDCTASGLHCVTLTGSLGAAGRIVCAHQSEVIVCVVSDFNVCKGTRLDYCDQHGNQSLDCTCLGYSGCSDGHCVP